MITEMASPNPSLCHSGSGGAGHTRKGDPMRAKQLVALAVVAMALASCGDDDTVMGAGDGQGLTIVEDGQLVDPPVGNAKGSMMKGEVGNTYVDLRRKVSRIDNISPRDGFGRDDAEDKHHDLCKSQLISVRALRAI